MARRLGLGQNPIGQRFRKEANPWQAETAYEIVGLVGDTKYFSLKEESQPIAYYSTAQDSDPDPNVRLKIRSRTPEFDTAAALRESLKAKYPALGTDFTRMDTIVQNGLLRERLLATVSGFFGLFAALIAAVGLYGVISYLVVRRTNEIGIRMALGASPRHVVQLVVSRATVLVSIGVIAGVITSVAAAQAARSMLFGLEPYDPATLALAAFALLATGLAASFVPAWRASRLDALAALRKDSRTFSPSGSLRVRTADHVAVRLEGCLRSLCGRSYRGHRFARSRLVANAQQPDSGLIAVFSRALVPDLDALQPAPVAFEIEPLGVLTGADCFAKRQGIVFAVGVMSHYAVEIDGAFFHLEADRPKKAGIVIDANLVVIGIAVNVRLAEIGPLLGERGRADGHHDRQQSQASKHVS